MDIKVQRVKVSLSLSNLLKKNIVGGGAGREVRGS